MTRRRALLRVAVGVLQIVLAGAALLSFVGDGPSATTLALIAATAAAVAASLVIFRHEA